MELLFASQNDADRDMYQFIMIVAASHELVHCFTGYLTGDARAQTPDAIGVRGHPGEAGHAWEALAFGGIVRMWGPHQNDVNQPGTAYLFADNDVATLGYRIRTQYIQSLVHGADGM
jgi:hypothetical protein